ncbi:MAG: DUF1697 domain-containing protein [Sphingomonadales bacterium]|nr:DUF1697 domain-containing protein [Sphingomonadales bacterium]MDE2570619.1 DUF1697 domain-containing protein [Sphingomonadales bacterium]
MRLAALLGSINVGGNRLKMEDLRAAMEGAGFADVETVVASGNVLFSHESAPDQMLGGEISKLIEREFAIRSVALVRTADELRAGITDNPFAQAGADKRVHTHFLEHQPSQAQFDALVADHAGRGSEALALGDRALYIDFVDGVAGSRLTSAFIERRLGYRGTARNMRSLARILERMT